MASNGRSGAIVEFPVVVRDPELQAVLDTLQAALGRLSPLVHITLLTDQAGYAVPVAAPTQLIGSVHLNTADAGLTQVRMGVGTDGPSDMTIDLFDATAGAVLLTMTATPTQNNLSPWTALTPWNDDHQLYARVHTDGTTAWTLHRVFLQFRTTHPV